MRYALPLLEAHDVPAVVFVCTGPPQSGELLWYDALERHGRADHVEAAKQLPYEQWRSAILPWRTLATDDDERAIMRPEEIARLAAHPLIEVGAHTVDHPVLSRANITIQRA